MPFYMHLLATIYIHISLSSLTLNSGMPSSNSRVLCSQAHSLHDVQDVVCIQEGRGEGAQNKGTTPGVYRSRRTELRSAGIRAIVNKKVVRRSRERREGRVWMIQIVEHMG